MERERLVNQTDSAVGVGDDAVADSDWTSRAHSLHVTGMQRGLARRFPFFGDCKG